MPPTGPRAILLLIENVYSFSTILPHLPGLGQQPSGDDDDDDSFANESCASLLWLPVDGTDDGAPVMRAPP